MNENEYDVIVDKIEYSTTETATGTKDDDKMILSNSDIKIVLTGQAVRGLRFGTHSGDTFKVVIIKDSSSVTLTDEEA